VFGEDTDYGIENLVAVGEETGYENFAWRWQPMKKYTGFKVI
jgi:hypothetical protein